METMDRRTLLLRSAAVAGGLAIAGPLEAFGARVRSGRRLRHPGYGPLVDMGDLWLPEGFQYRILQERGDPMSDLDPAGNPRPAPSRFDGMAAFGDPVTGDTILIRNHENRRRRGNPLMVETPVIVPNPYDGAIRPQDGLPFCHGGVTRLVVQNRELQSSTAVLGGTIWNCAGGVTPWGTWISCEEEAANSGVSNANPIQHGYVFEVDPFAAAPFDPLPIRTAGRFDHEAVVWHGASLYLTEDKGAGPLGAAIPACFYRYTPDTMPTAFGELAGSTGPLEALVVDGYPNLNTSTAWPAPIGEPLPVSWVAVPNPDPTGPNPNDAPQAVRAQAQATGAATFERTEGCWLAGERPRDDDDDDDDDERDRSSRRRKRERIYFDCTTGGPLRMGQIWELNPEAMELRLVFQSDDATGLFQPDNLTIAPTGDLFICEDTGGDPVPHIRALTPEGRLYDFARAGRGGQLTGVNGSEFCGAVFATPPVHRLDRGRSLRDLTLYVNQQGDGPATGAPGVTYAIWGPWKRREEDDDD